MYFTPGIYVIKNGEFELISGSSSSGDGVHLKVRGGADTDFMAMTDGDNAGILFAQDPYAAPGEVSDVQGGGNVRRVGALHFPTKQVDVGDNGDLGLNTDAWASSPTACAFMATAACACRPTSPRPDSLNFCERPASSRHT